MKVSRLVAVLAVMVAVSGCSTTTAALRHLQVGPNYERPATQLPERFRGQADSADAASLADLPWWNVFGDPALQRLVREALENNYDLKTAIARVEQFRAQVGVAASDLYPQVGYGGAAAREKTFVPLVPGGNHTMNFFSGVLDVAWEIDVWGRIRRSTEAARAQFLASADVRRGVMLSLVSNVAAGYFRLLELDREREIARSSAETYQQTLDFFTQRYEGGKDTKLSTSRAEASLAASFATIARLDEAILQQENAIRELLGAPPGPIDRGTPLTTQSPPAAPLGLTSDLLQRRPDILRAEQDMVTANAEIGVAVANFFPRIGLAAFYGGGSDDIGDMFKRDFSIWNIAGSVSGPIFQGGRLVEQYRARQAFWDETIAAYRGTIIQALREVADALASQSKLVERRAAQERQVKALAQAVELSLDRYRMGLANYYEVLEAEQQLYPAEDALAQSQRDQLLTVVTLYKALGGGWNLAEDAWTDVQRAR
ncbi:MAG TPA: efflux transporter outer membrane subunit [Candidatus Margulisiibacteriota bacterium]|nr:efflux transporter outer membrane subunit [Candidatus Margulisiibacteriota bacterium]